MEGVASIDGSCPLQELVRQVRDREVGSRELVEEALARVAADDRFRAFVHVDGELALTEAAAVDEAVAAGEPVGALVGVPFGVKDLEDVRGMPTSKAARWFAGTGPAVRDEVHVGRFRAAGAIPIGKTATPAFGAAAHTASDVFGVTRNPWDLATTPGGSSGGSAAAIAAGFVPFATASDGGGSIRTPAAYTSLPGLRPCYGRVPSYGSTHLAQNAVNFALTRTVLDTAFLLDIAAGAHPYDRTSLPDHPGSFLDATTNLDVGGLSVGYSAAFGIGEVDREVGEIVEEWFESFVAHAGLVRSTVAELKLPFLWDVYTKVAGVDRFVDLPEGLWPDRADELEERLRPGWESNAKARLPQLARIYTERRRVEETVAAYFDEVDVLVTPATGIPPFAAEGPIPETVNGVEVHPFVNLIQPIMASLCNLPAIAVPCGLTSKGLPVAAQIVAGRFREDVCLRLARLAEEAAPFPTLPHRH